jgi:hypothetical protein
VYVTPPGKTADLFFFLLAVLVDLILAWQVLYHVSHSTSPTVDLFNEHLKLKAEQGNPHGR